MNEVEPKRGPGRPRKVELSPVRAAIAEPLPDVEQLALAVQQAREAMEAAATARDAATIEAAPGAMRAAIETARRELDAALVKKQIGEQFGEDDTPTDDDIAALEKALADAQAREAGAESSKVAWAAEIERRREALDAAQRAFAEALTPWRQGVRDAADKQMADAVLALSEAQAALKEIDRWRGIPALLCVPRVNDSGLYDRVETVELPRAAAAVLAVEARANRVLLRH